VFDAPPLIKARENNTAHHVFKHTQSSESQKFENLTHANEPSKP